MTDREDRKALAQRRGRQVQYVAAGALSAAFALAAGLGALSWPAELNALEEVLAATLALWVGLMALVQFRVFRRGLLFLVAAAWMGTALFDVLHVVLATPALAGGLEQTPMADWAWSLSRWMLAGVMVFGVWLSRSGRHLGVRGSIVLTVSLLVVLTGISVLVPRPAAIGVMTRPEELVPTVALLLVLVHFVQRDHWDTDLLHHGLMLSLILGLGAQVLALCSTTPTDGAYGAAHLLKVFSYAAVVYGLLASSAQHLSHARAVSREREVFFERSLEILCIAGFDGYFKQLNPAWTQTLGWSTRELKARQYLDFVHPEDREATRQAAASLAEGQELVSFENRYQAKDGTYRRLRWNCATDVEDKLMYAAARDVTEHHEMARERLESEERFRNLFENTSDMIHSVAEDGSFVYVNPAWKRVLGYNEAEVQSMAIGQLVDHDGLLRYGDLLAAENTAGTSGPVEMRLQGKDGRARMVEGHASIRRAGDGRKEAVAVLRDVTERKLAEASLLEANVRLSEALERAKSADQVKSAFLATMSHELRTPLNSIIGFTGVLLQELPGPLNQEQAKQLGMVQKSSRHLLELINDILDISKIEAGQLDLDLGVVRVPESVEKAVSLVTPMADEAGIELSWTCACELDEPIISDKRRFEQILLNLLTNAVKFTEEGSVHVDCLADSDQVRIDVVDTGIGVAVEHMDALFKEFRQVDSGLSRRRDGTGLGLAISRRLSRMMGGDLTAESSLGKGSTFTLTLPGNTPGSTL